MIFGSVCSGIEAASVAWEPLGFRASFLSEIDAFPRAVLLHRYPSTALHGDFTTIEADQYEPIDILVGGTPCQDFSVAGLRAGIAGERGNLTLEFLRLAQRLRPSWLVFENVPGLLSSDGGRAFGALLGGMGQLGYGTAYRVLDAQHFGVPQRRRRVFVVGYLGDWRRAAAVLFERESLSGNPSPRREAKASVAGTIGGTSPGGGWRIGADEAAANQLVALTCGDRGLSVDQACGGMAIPILEPGRRTGRSTDDARIGMGISAHGDPMFTLNAQRPHGIAIGEVSGTLNANGKAAGSATQQDAEAGSLDTSSPQAQAIASGGVRRLTPRECERLQGFPDDWTAVPYRGKPAADGNRYKALGNSMAVPVVRWIGERIKMVQEMTS